MLTEQQRSEAIRIIRKDPLGAIAVMLEQPGATPHVRSFLRHLEAEFRYQAETREQAEAAGAQ